MLNRAFGLDEQKGIQRDGDLYIVPFRRIGKHIQARVSYATVLSDWHEVRLSFPDVEKADEAIREQAYDMLQRAKDAARADAKCSWWSRISSVLWPTT